MWRAADDVSSLNLFYGPGGKQHQPSTRFTFVKDDSSGTNPKFVVKDEEGTKWKVKLGAEARPETVATRLVWAAGYFADEDYFLDAIQVQGIGHLKRGGDKVGSDGTVHNVRLERDLKGQKKLGIWKWKDEDFAGTREWNGLRVMMALINNWDLKDVNNAIVELSDGRQRLYMVSDLGATFGSPNPTWPHDRAKGNLKRYAGSKFITGTERDSVDFAEPGEPAPIYLFHLSEYFHRRGLRWIGKDIPRADARWIGEILGRLSSTQIRDAFRAAGYGPNEIEGFSSVVEKRIAALKAL